MYLNRMSCGLRLTEKSLPSSSLRKWTISMHSVAIKAVTVVAVDVLHTNTCAVVTLLLRLLGSGMQ